MSNKFPGDIDAAGSHLENYCTRSFVMDIKSIWYNSCHQRAYDTVGREKTKNIMLQ
jgi:hypothetical protein